MGEPVSLRPADLDDETLRKENIRYRLTCKHSSFEAERELVTSGSHNRLAIKGPWRDDPQHGAAAAQRNAMQRWGAGACVHGLPPTSHDGYRANTGPMASTRCAMQVIGAASQSMAATQPSGLGNTGFVVRPSSALLSRKLFASSSSTSPQQVGRSAFTGRPAARTTGVAHRPQTAPLISAGKGLRR